MLSNVQDMRELSALQASERKMADCMAELRRAGCAEIADSLAAVHRVTVEAIRRVRPLVHGS
jgi:pyruvate-formate lyase